MKSLSTYFPAFGMRENKRYPAGLPAERFKFINPLPATLRHQSGAIKPARLAFHFFSSCMPSMSHAEQMSHSLVSLMILLYSVG